MRILVTGGAGFIGSHVADTYINEGHHVAIVDNLSTGALKNVNHEAIFYKADICDGAEMQRIMSIEKPEIICHQAAMVSVTQSTQKPLLAYEANVLGTINLLIAGAPYIKKFIFASTGGAMYAKPKKFPAVETEIPSPISPYGFSKLLAEEAIAFYAKQHKFSFTVLRYANVFGPRQNAHGESGVIAIFSELAQRGKQPTIYRKQTTRDYVYVADVARANLLALAKGSGEVINIGTATEASTQQVYERVAKVFDWRVLPRYEAARPGELLRSVLSNKKAKKLLCWEPEVEMTSGLKLIKESLV